jgi:phosphopantetheinyl transferase
MIATADIPIWYASIEEVLRWADRLVRDGLGAAERDELARCRDPGRRRAWQAGRLAAKRLVLDHFPLAARPPHEIEILSRDSAGQATRPRVYVRGQRMPWRLSISHSGRHVYVALSEDPDVSVGVDLAPVQVYGEGFLETWFTAGEQRALRVAPSAAVATFWAVKEAVYKACNDGEKFAPAQVEVRRNETGLGCSYRGVDLTGAAEIHAMQCPGHAAVLVRYDLWHSRPRLCWEVRTAEGGCATLRD